MNAINITLGIAVAVAPISAPLGTSVLALRLGYPFATVAATSNVFHCRSDAAVIRRCALAHTSAAFFAADATLFAHIGNVAAFTAGHGLAQPAV